MKFLPFVLLLFFVSCGILDSSNSDESKQLKFGDDIVNELGLEISNDILAMTSYSDGVHFYDIKKRTKPEALSTYTLVYAKKTRIFGNYAYIMTGHDGYSVSDNKVTIVDISNIKSPEFISEISFDKTGREVLVDNNTLYIAAGTSGLLIFDISDKENPQKIAEYYEENSLFNIYDLKLSGNYLYLADFFNGVKILDITSPSNPEKIAQYITAQQNNCKEIELYNSKVIMLDFWDKNYDILELDANNQLDSIATIDFQRDYDTTPTELLVDGNSLFASAWWQHALEFDMTNIQSVSIKNEWSFKGQQISIAVTNDYVYVLNQDGIEIIKRD